LIPELLIKQKYYGKKGEQHKKNIMRKMPIVLLVLFFSMCKIPIVKFDDKNETNFTYQKSVLKEFEATESKYSLLIFTTGFEGEKVKINNCNNNVYEMLLKTQKIQPFAKILRVENICNTKLVDIDNLVSFELKSENLTKYKFVSIHRDYNKNKRYIVTYSNKMKVIL